MNEDNYDTLDEGYGDTPGITKEKYTPSQNDKFAAAEEETLRKESLESLSADHRRTEVLKSALGRVIVCLVYGLFTLFFITILLVAWHYLGPPHLHWIEESRMDTITATIFSGTFFAAIGLYVRDRIKPPSY